MNELYAPQSYCFIGVVIFILGAHADGKTKKNIGMSSMHKADTHLRDLEKHISTCQILYNKKESPMYPHSFKIIFLSQYVLLWYRGLLQSSLNVKAKIVHRSNSTAESRRAKFSQKGKDGWDRSVQQNKVYIKGIIQSPSESQAEIRLVLLQIR